MSVVHDHAVLPSARKIHSNLENDVGNWTCVNLMSSAMPQGMLQLWLLDESDATDKSMAKMTNDEACTSDNAPDMDEAFEIDEST